MRTKLIATITVGSLYEELATVSHPSIKAYADRVNADFIVLTDVQNKLPGYAKLELIRHQLQSYERVLFVDTDILIRHDAPDLFRLVKPECFGVFNEGKLEDRTKAKLRFIHQTNLGTRKWADSGKYFNTGVMLCSRSHRTVFANPIGEVDNYAEQTLLNWRLHSLKVPIQEIPMEFNRLPLVTALTGRCIEDAFFVHFAGAFSNDNPNTQMNLQTFKQLGKDFDMYREHSLVPEFRRSLYVETAGAVGDVVATEPVVRYIREVVDTKATLVIKTHFPEVFAHLESINPLTKVLGPQETMPDTGFLKIHLWPEPPIANFNLMPPVDYASLAAFRGLIPNQNRRIVLRPAPVFSGLHNHVLVHPGRSWKSKTFPAPWWNQVIKGLMERQIPVAIIGKDSEDKGTVDVDATGCLDLRNQLTLPELFRVIKDAPILISNDSAPVHIAGAFDNYCLLIATCKRPEYILPYRDPNLNIVMGLPIRNASPAIGIVDDIRIDDCTDLEMIAALPLPSTVVKAVAVRYPDRPPNKDRYHGDGPSNHAN